ncbi:Exocyst complex component 2 [Acorus calamus]|uniref:Exocyst complex component SEC5 n=1 Tax=Acorus calamus TaxID=4465 RepID=A0AAV9DHW9_ACOCL|nr:Exocyst complex component 2 [Acorus calamus]
MSSDSDDIDEDELLQIALKEQAERDLNYRRPMTTSKKPVVNLIQPPPQPPPAKNRKPNPKPGSGVDMGGGKGRRGGDDDDESEVELLSISSGDGYDEPKEWKQVDEGELVRRVREMRETRAAPVVLDRKASTLGRKGLTNLQSLPRGIEFVDPLGLGLIDIKTLTLINEGPESSPTYRKEKLDKDPLDPSTRDIESKLRRIEEDPEGAGTDHLFKATQNVNLLANRAFEPLFERQAQAEKIRSVQGMLQRFRTLFNLPSAIRGSISKGEYDLAVREYRKAKSIVLPSHVSILKRVLEEVEKVMHEFKGMLYRLMEDPQIELAELENTVRLLLDLEPESDPLWHYLNIQNRRIRGLLEKCTLDHEARMEALNNEIQERVLSDERWRQIQRDSNKSLDADYSLLLGSSHSPVDSHPPDVMGEKVDTLRGRYIRRLTAVLIHHLPAFWRLAVSVFSGKLVKSSQVAAGNMLLDSETNTKLLINKSEDKAGDIKYSNHSLDEVAEMVHNTISAFEVKVHNTFRDFEESNVLRPHMREAIKEISKACQALEGKEAAPPTAVKTLRELHFEIAKIYILRLCSWMRATAEEISKDESWIPLSMLERNKSPYRISFLPMAFHAMVVSAMDQIDMMIQSLRSEAAKSNDMFMQVQEVHESVRLAFLNCFLDFAGYLERIGGELTSNRSNKENSYLQNGYLYESEERICGIHPGNAISDSHQKLLIILSNIGYCKDQLSHELYNKYKNIWLQSRDEEDPDIRDLVMSFSALEEKVLEQYTYAKANLIRNAALDYLMNDGVHWGAAPAVKGIRDAAIELLHSLVEVHAEVFAGAKPLLEKTLVILVEGLIDTFLSLFNEYNAKDLKSLDTNGFCQLMLELEYFETVLNAYFSPEARESLKSLQGLLLEKATESVTDSVENPGHHRKSTRGSEDALMDDRQQGFSTSPDDLIVLAQQCSADLLAGELERTRMNIACFMESSHPLTPGVTPRSNTTSRSTYSPRRGVVGSPAIERLRTSQSLGSPSFRQRRK